MISFREREDTESIFRNQIMPIFAVSHGGQGLLAIVSGMHYLDVMSIERPLECCNPLHPITSTEAGEWRARSLELARQSGGGSASDGNVIPELSFFRQAP